MRNCNRAEQCIADRFLELSESDLYENKLGDRMIKQLLNSVI